MQLVATEDGSLSLKDPATGELFHNRAGAFTEALLNYVRPSGALKCLEEKSRLTILDVCFGLGYNSFVLIEEALQLGARGTIYIQAIETDPTLFSLLPQILSNAKFEKLASMLNLSELTDKKCVMAESSGLKVELSIEIASLRQVVPRLKEDFDVVFHDPFSPSHKPQLWTVNLFHEYHRILSKFDGAVLTYCSAAGVRGGLIEAGFNVKRTFALGGKSGGTIGLVSSNDKLRQELDVYELDESELTRINSLSGIPYRDEEFSQDRKSILLSRQQEQERYRRRD
ncbi:MAG: hypothetical protein K2X81_05210 [Candidatus Obscuribacterales bacterium]|nr:hypothetical protein [Candidatus Obscuribacterales bacterium]